MDLDYRVIELTIGRRKKRTLTLGVDPRAVLLRPACQRFERGWDIFGLGLWVGWFRDDA